MKKLREKSKYEVTLEQESYPSGDGWGEFSRIKGYLIKDPVITGVSSNGEITILAYEGNDFPVEVVISAPEITIIKKGDIEASATIYPDGRTCDRSGNMKELFSDEVREKFNIPDYCFPAEDEEW